MKRLLVLVMVLLSLAMAFNGAADEPAVTHSAKELGTLSDFDRWVGRQLHYNIKFLWFDSIAEATLSVTAGEAPDTYRAILEARTLGVAAWLTSDRVQRYVSVMEKTAEGPLRALSYRSQIIKGRGKKRQERTREYRFDHEHRQVSYRRGSDGEFGEAKLVPMPEGTSPNDILTAFFNFQAGFFGPVVTGGRYRIPTFTRKGTAYIEAEVLSDRSRVRPDFFPSDGLLLKVILDPEVFDTAGGGVYICFDERRRPAWGIVENVIGLGDVYGTLTESFGP